MVESVNRRFTDSPEGSPSTVIGKGTHIQGEITGSNPIEISGSLNGTAGTEAVFWVRQGGEIRGEIAARNTVIEGHVEGRISAAEKVELRSTCKVRGNICARTVAIAEGSFFEGQIEMGQDGEAPRQVRFREKRQDHTD